jgi:hypothetical protein
MNTDIEEMNTDIEETETDIREKCRDNEKVTEMSQKLQKER